MQKIDVKVQCWKWHLGRPVYGFAAQMYSIPHFDEDEEVEQWWEEGNTPSHPTSFWIVVIRTRDRKRE